jgi:hypothetical protein
MHCGGLARDLIAVGKGGMQPITCRSSLGVVGRAAGGTGEAAIAVVRQNVAQSATAPCLVQPFAMNPNDDRRQSAASAGPGHAHALSGACEGLREVVAVLCRSEQLVIRLGLCTSLVANGTTHSSAGGSGVRA